MATYVALCNFTEGVRTAKDNSKRADAVKEAASKFGARMSRIYWTLGPYDLVTVIDAADDAAATVFGLAIASAGNIRMQTLRAFSKDEMAGILSKL